VKKATIALFAVVIALQIAILAIVAMDYWNFPSAPSPTHTPTPTPTPTATPTPSPSPTPTPTPTNYPQITGDLTITSATYVDYGYGQLWVRFNWTGQSFKPPRIRLSIEEHAWWWTTGKYVINQTGNRDPLIWDVFPLGDYAADAQIELAFFDTEGVQFRSAHYPAADIVKAHWTDLK
jgi:hypothetical protein